MTYKTPSLSSLPATMSLRDVYYVIFRHKKKVIGFFAAVVILVTAATLAMPKVYQSTAQLLLKLGRENVTLDPTATIGTSPINVNQESRETEINSEIEVLKSRELAEKVVDTLGTDAILSVKKHRDFTSRFDSLQARELAVQQIEKSLSVELVKKTNIIGMVYLSHSPQAAHDVVSQLIRLYQEKHMAIFRPEASYRFIEQQKDELSAVLKTIEDSLRLLKNRSGIVSVPEQQTSLLSRLTQLQLEFERGMVDEAAGTAKVNDLEKTIETIPQLMASHKMSGTPLSSSEVLRTKINELQVQQLDLLTKFNDNSRRVRDLKQQISQAKAILDTENVNQNSSDAVRQLQTELLQEKANLAAITARNANLKSQIDAARGEMASFNNNSETIARLQRQLALNEENFRKYNENLEQARIDSGLKNEKLSNISIVQAPTLPFKSTVTSRRILNIIFGMLFGLCGGLGLAFAFELLDHTIKRFDDIEIFLGVPALGVIPVLDNNTLIPWKIPRQCAQTFDGMREMLRLAGNGGGAPKVLAVVSSYDGEGVDTIAPFLAINQLSPNTTGKVLLADFDTAEPSLHSIFSVPQMPGVADLQRPVDGHPVTPAAFNGVAGLEILPAGKQHDGTLHLNKSKHFAQAMQNWKNSYDCIVCKMPPISRSSLMMEIAEYIDDVILVVESERVRREVLIQSTSKLARSGINVTGVILNKYRYYLPQWLYKTL